MESTRIDVLSSKELYTNGEIKGWEYKSDRFANKRIIKFHSLTDAMTFATEFVHSYLIPKYGLDETRKFPMAKTGPWRDFGDTLNEALGATEPYPNQETWLVVPEKRFEEVEKYLQDYAEKHNTYVWQPDRFLKAEEELKNHK